MRSGDRFDVPLSFTVASAFPLREGILIQRKDTNLLELFYLGHPADRLASVALTPPTSNAPPPPHSLISTCNDSSLVISYDSESKRHSIWQMREEVKSAVLGDSVSVKPKHETPSSFGDSTATFPPPSQGSLQSKSSIGRGHGSLVKEIFHRKWLLNQGGGSGGEVKSSTSPFFRLLDAPARLKSAASTTVCSEVETTVYTSNYGVTSSLAVDLVRIWTDEFESTRARRVFLCENLVGQAYVCLCCENETKLVEYTVREEEVSVQKQSILHVKDIVPLQNAKMTLVLQNDGRLCLYSGLDEICRVLCDDLSISRLLATARDNIIVETSNDDVYVGSFPSSALSSTSVDFCIKGLVDALDSSTAHSLLCQWQRIRLTNESSPRGFDDAMLFKLFCDFLLNCTGLKPKNVIGSDEMTIEDFLSSNSILNCGESRYLRCLPKTMTSKRKSPPPKTFCFDSTPLLSGCISTVIFALHLVHEEMRLNQLLKERRCTLAETLFILTTYWKWDSYSSYYKNLYPTLQTQQVNFERDSPICDPLYKDPPQIIAWLLDALDNLQEDAFPVIPRVNRTCIDVCILFSLLVFDQNKPTQPTLSNIIKPLGQSPINKDEILRDVNTVLQNLPGDLHSPAEQSLFFMASRRWTPDLLDMLPRGVASFLNDVLDRCRENPPACLPTQGYVLLGRDDLARQERVTTIQYRLLSHVTKGKQSPEVQQSSKAFDDFDGTEHLMDDEIVRVRFSQDRRIREVCRLLQSSKPVRIALEQKPEVSDHEFIELQEKRLFLVCQRTMSLPVARGMFTLGTTKPIITVPLSIPKLNLNGRAPPRDNTISLSNVETPPSMTNWPSFHNGVAAGLCIDPNMKEVSSAWIAYNMPSSAEVEISNEQAGFLLALGLNGHLKKLAVHHLHSYLSKAHEMTTIGLLIGLAAARRGTMDLEVTRILSVHIPALLPAGSTQLNVPSLAQVAALIGLGLVYQGSAHRHITQVLLADIGRPAGPELEHSNNRESYALAAGLALGMVTLGKGDTAMGLADLKLRDNLKLYMTGGGPEKMLYKEKPVCYKIHEGPGVNVHVTGPPAIVALGLMYLKTNDDVVGNWLKVPDSIFMLEFIRPDMLTLMTLCRGLILWDSVVPSSTWVNSHVPPIVARKSGDFARQQSSETKMLGEIRIHVIAGACMAIGMRFAGTSNKAAFDCLMERVKYFIKLSSSPSEANFAAEYCLDCSLLALALVMAGSGNLSVMRLIRQLHPRLNGPEIRYGSHMAVHMALGLLFLGGGQYSVSRTNGAIAALMCSLFPMFPTTSVDNRYHMQALRHFYVLACERRLLVTREVDTMKPCYVPITVTYKENTRVSLLAPCIIPPIEDMLEIALSSPRYLPRKLLGSEKLRELLHSGGSFLVQRRSGHRRYEDDPKGHHSLSTVFLKSEEEKKVSMSSEAALSAKSSGLLPRERWLINRLPVTGKFGVAGHPSKAALEQMMSATVKIKSKEEEENDLFCMWTKRAGTVS
ncbi:anaphase-promoting complex subunit 1-like isoform X2 [Oscarella lobularis]